MLAYGVRRIIIRFCLLLFNFSYVEHYIIKGKNYKMFSRLCKMLAIMILVV